ncbi:MAG: hypothetical protein NTZ05_12595 [Chloroflexi bacterium]|nr:hypothetical protein [Chloroflexota bacterium]
MKNVEMRVEEGKLHIWRQDRVECLQEQGEVEEDRQSNHSARCTGS